jgi:hypothetical protein
MGLLSWLSPWRWHWVEDAPAYAEPPVLPPAPSQPYAMTLKAKEKALQPPPPCEPMCGDCTCDGIEGLAGLAGFVIVGNGPDYSDDDPEWYFLHQGGDWYRTDRFTFETLMDAAVDATLLKIGGRTC